MKFLVTRTSGFGFREKDKPCKNAIKKYYTVVDERTIDNPMKNPFIGESWYKNGTRHRVENGHIKRNLRKKGWFIEINSLEELIEFQKEYGRIIIEETYLPALDGTLKIEIYDDYRE